MDGIDREKLTQALRALVFKVAPAGDYAMWGYQGEFDDEIRAVVDAIAGPEDRTSALKATGVKQLAGEVTDQGTRDDLRLGVNVLRHLRGKGVVLQLRGPGILTTGPGSAPPSEDDWMLIENSEDAVKVLLLVEDVSARKD